MSRSKASKHKPVDVAGRGVSIDQSNACTDYADHTSIDQITYAVGDAQKVAVAAGMTSIL
jgi:hypothetical protein